MRCLEEKLILWRQSATRPWFWIWAAAMVAIRGAFTADGHTMDDYFDKIYLSYELHELKPSEAIFRKVIADSGVIPAETLFIDDGRKNVDAAQALGFAVYMPAPGEDFGHLFEEITR